ncbi:MAG: carbohydrate binding family 9 domain-containing protein, partial [Gemmatimonadaceae bacterium]|nr:carbohydrate binding family 9 domain-containing protein [Chitinophagaceae bacterium]
IYIAAYLYDDPRLIRKQFTTRDNHNRSDADYFSVFLDTYNDHQNAFQFLVTTRNVQTDSRVSPTATNGFGQYGDISWDAVWDSKIQMQKDGWTVEIKIPHFSIRFAKKEIQDWGVNFLRFTRRNNETTFWNPVDPNISGFVNQFGDLNNLQSLAPPLRLSFSPYVSAGNRSTPELKSGYRKEWLKSGGLDVKYGLNESFTLDATLIPDFGQVISDNVVNNITPFEQQFLENRPFFTEGTELFNKAGIFYSRRIGKTPPGYFDVKAFTDTSTIYDNIKNPSVTRLYNALKFSGRNKHNLGIGIFNSVTQSVSARVRNRIDGRDSIIRTEDLANYNIIVLDQVLKNRSYITFTNTNVMRNGSARDANVAALDVALYDRANTYALLLKPRYSKLFGEGGYDGFKNTTRVGKVSGRWQWHVLNELETPGYNPNDLGFILSPNEFTVAGSLSYNLFTATKNFLNQRYAIGVEQSYLYRPWGYQKTEIRPSVFWFFKNFWDISISVPFQPMWYNDYFELQTPGKTLKRSPYYSMFVNGSSDSRKKLFVSWNLGFAEGPLPSDPFNSVQLGARYRFSDRLTVDATVTRQYDNGQWGLANNGRNFIFDGAGDPVIARRKFTDISTVLSGAYNFTSRMNLTFRARHYWNRLQNTNLYRSQPDGYWNERFDLTPSDFNANYNVFNLDVFYTWDFRLGSRIIIGYKNWLGNDYLNAVEGTKYRDYSSNLGNVFSRPHGNEVTLRFIYFLNYTDLKKKQ